MNPTDTLNQALNSVSTEEKRLLGELAKIQAVRKALEDAIHAKAPLASIRSKAAPGGLKTAILGVLDGTPKSNSEIRASLETQGYAYSLTPLHVSKTLTKLLREEKVRRSGRGAACRYTRRAGK